jgi:hypothetical protein
MNKIKIGYTELSNKVNQYLKQELKKPLLIRNLLIIYGMISYNITSKYISSIYYLIGAVALILSLILTIYILYNTIKFIINYKLKCNPNFYVKFLVISKVVVLNSTAGIIGTIGSAVALDQFSTVYFDYSPLKGLRRVQLGEISFYEFKNEFKSKIKN